MKIMVILAKPDFCISKSLKIRILLSCFLKTLLLLQLKIDTLFKHGIFLTEDLITDEFQLEQAAEAYALMAGGNCGKVAVVFGDQNK